jgi:hypothetical protein
VASIFIEICNSRADVYMLPESFLTSNYRYW